MTSSSVITLYRDRDTFIHRRDPRVKLLLLILLFFFLFLAKSWQWMLVAVFLGLIQAAVARTPWKWLTVLWAIHLPTFIALILIPAAAPLLAGNFAKVAETAAAELRLILAWSAAIFVSVSTLSTMDSEDLTRGIRGLRFPPVVALAVGLSYRLLYATIDEAFRIADAMKIKGVDLNPKHFFRFLWNSLRLSLPLMLAIIRRAPTLMSALEMRGFRRGSARLGNIDFWDGIYFLIGLSVFVLAIGDRFGWLPFSLSNYLSNG
jgi:energy-coupling factor transport system permease protein